MGKQSAALLLDPREETIRCWEEGLAGLGLNLIRAAGRSEALEVVESHYCDLVFLSEHLPGDDAGELLLDLLERFPEIVVSVYSDRPVIDQAVEFMRLGAFSYIPRPTDPAGAAALAQEALDFLELRREKVESRRRVARKYDVEHIVGESPPMQSVFRLIHKVAATDSTVLILGESGTGKELVARAIHYQSSRSEHPMVPVNCGAIPGELLESELFGHEKGAFTGAIRTRVGRFELAAGGTIFLDEIGDMSPMLQVKLLRVLQEHRFERVGGARTLNADLRVLAATNADLKKKVADGTFREDLYYRLNVVPIRVPPLREHISDIPLLCNHFLERLSRQKGMAEKKLHPETLQLMMRYNWPGNVRELENLLERMVILAEGDIILPEDLPPKLAGDAALPPAADRPTPALAAPGVPEEGLDFNEAVDAFERHLIMEALTKTDWVKNRAAALLRLNRTTLVEKIKKKGLAPPDSAGDV